MLPTWNFIGTFFPLCYSAFLPGKHILASGSQTRLSRSDRWCFICHPVTQNKHKNSSTAGGHHINPRHGGGKSFMIREASRNAIDFTPRSDTNGLRLNAKSWHHEGELMWNHNCFDISFCSQILWSGEKNPHLSQFFLQRKSSSGGYFG